jgi:hypothetical protein
MNAIIRWTAVLYLFCAPTFAHAGSLLFSGSFVGYNEGWFKGLYGSDLTKSGYDARYVARILDGIAQGGATIVRIWPFAGLQGIPLGQYSPQTKSVDPVVMTNLQKVISMAACRGLKVYLTLLNGGDMRNANGGLRNYYWNLLHNNYGERDAYKNNVLVPLMQTLYQYRSAIYAVDLINEIEASLNANYFPNYWVGARSWIQDMTAFIKSVPCRQGVTNCVTGSWLPVTAAAGWGYAVQEITFGLFSGLGLDFYDLHAYADSGQYPGQTALCSKVSSDKVPIILGEYGQGTQTDSDWIQYNATSNFLYGARTHCFSAALGWRYEDATQTWFTFLRPDGGFRWAYYFIQQNYGAPRAPACPVVY